MFSRTCSQTPGASLPLAPGPEKPLIASDPMKTIHHGPPVFQNAFYLPIPTSDVEYHRASQGSLRKAVEAQIETLLAFLDFIDVDPDIEQTTNHDDREGDGADDEPSIGRAEAESLQDVDSNVGCWGMEDGELDRCDDEDSHDLECAR